MRGDLTIAEFWLVKREIDKEIERVGWTKEKCVAYIYNRYHSFSRLAMTDQQLIHFASFLRSLPDFQPPEQEAIALSKNKKTLKNRLRVHF